MFGEKGIFHHVCFAFHGKGLYKYKGPITDQILHNNENSSEFNHLDESHKSVPLLIMEWNEGNGPASRGQGSSTSSSSAARLGSRHEEGTGRPFGSPAATLIQSAARSMLDEATPDTAVSGVSDGESDSEVVDGRYGRLRSVDLSTLSSLQHRTDQPAIPNEQDRKRFIVSFQTCLRIIGFRQANTFVSLASIVCILGMSGSNSRIIV